jgi:predicted  nucleic acid-binding Zn-ribbon protein
MSATTAAPGLRIRQLKIDNWLRLQCVEINANGRHVKLSGPNGSGKTSVLDAVWAAIKGVSVRQFPEPIHRGGESARIRLDLGEVVIERKITDKGAGLVVTRKDGSRVPKPQQFLDSLFSAICLDPGQFLSLRPQDQVDQVLAVCGVQPPVGDVLAIIGPCGVDEEARGLLEPRPNESASAYLERLSADETGFVYIRRREAHREIAQKSAALEEERRKFDAIGGPLNAGEAEESVSKLAARLQELNQQEDARRAALAEAEQAQREFEAGHRKLSDLVAERAAVNDHAAAVRREIDALQAKLSKSIDAMASLDARISRAQAADGPLAELRATAEAAAEAAQRLPDTGRERAEIARRMEDAERLNARLVERRLWGRQLEATAKGVEDARAKHERLDVMLGRLRDLRRNLLNGVDLGIRGLELGDCGLRLNGVPLRQASRAQQLEVGLALAMRGDPELRLIRLDDAEHLDAAAKGRVLERADERGFQVLMTCVADGDFRIDFEEAT